MSENNDIFFTAKTTYNDKAYYALSCFILRKIRIIPRLLLLGLGILLILSSCYIYYKNIAVSIGIILIFLLGNTIFLSSIFAEKFMEKLLLAENKAYGTLLYTYTFYEKCFKIENVKENKNFEYSEILKVYDTNSYFFIFLENKRVYILSKSKFDKGTPELLREFLEKATTLKDESDLNKF